MMTGNSRLTTWGVALAAVALLASAWVLSGAARPVAAQADPAQLLEEGVDALNRGDLDAVMELYTDDAAFAGIVPCAPVQCAGRGAIRNAMELYVADNLRITITSSDVSGNMATGSAEVTSDMVRAAGVERFVSSYTVEVSGDKISRLQFDFDVGDAQTSDFLTYVGANSLTVELGPGRDADLSPGWVELMRFGDRTLVALSLTAPGLADVRQPANIHEGTCANLGAVAYPLQDVVRGVSAVVLELPLNSLIVGNLAINVQKSYDEPDTYVACGNIPALMPAEGAEPAAAPVAGSGGLEEGGGIWLTAWWCALAAGFALLVVGGLLGLVGVRSRRRG